MKRVFKEVKKPSLPSLFSKQKKQVFTSLLEKSNRYFEFGCGGSTSIASLYENLQITSVESDQGWATKVQSVCPSVNMHWIDIGSTKEFGYPADESTNGCWNQYPEAWLRSTDSYDLVLIDGRFRVACAAIVCLHPKNSKYICFDDFVDRPQYHVIKPFIEVIQTVENMIVCRPKPSNNREDLQKLYDEYKFNPA